MCPGVQQLDLDVADAHLVAVLMRGQVRHRNLCDPRNPLRFMGIDVNRDADPLQQLCEALEFESHHRPAHMIGVVMRHQHAGQSHAVAFDGVEQIAGGVGRVDHHGVAGLPVTDQIREIAHLGGHRVPDREIASGEQLAEIQPVGFGHALYPKAAVTATAVKAGAAGRRCRHRGLVTSWPRL